VDLPRLPRHGHERSHGAPRAARLPAARCGGLPHRADLGCARHAGHREPRHALRRGLVPDRCAGERARRPRGCGAVPSRVLAALLGFGNAHTGIARRA
jgi:hypothetical protein